MLRNQKFGAIQRCLVITGALVASIGFHANEQSVAEEQRGAATNDTAEQRAIYFLQSEIVRWSNDNVCYSCHNQGDAARVLFTVTSDAMILDDPRLQPTRTWLANPTRWNDNKGDQRFSDLQLATVQFASALAAMTKYAPTDQHEEALRIAADRLAEHQSDDGSWAVKTGGIIGSPITYGPPLATAISASVLRQVDRTKYASQLRRAESYLRTCKTGATVDMAAVLLGLERVGDRPGNQARLEQCQDQLLRSQHRSGSWGPYPDYAPEVFDTAIAMIALQQQPVRADMNKALEKARHYLCEQQLADGGWPETTRPDFQESYAHRVSTSAWATQALIATSREER